jgi:hypothetical protein
MRYHEITEAIANPPRALGAYVRKRISELKSIVSARDRAAQIVSANEKLGEPMLNYFLRYGSDNVEAANDLGYAIHIAKNLDRYRPLDQLLSNLEAFLAHGHEFRRYVLNSFAYAEPIPEDAKKTFSVLDTAEVGAEKYGFKPNDPDNAKDEEFVAAMALLEGLRLFDGAYQKGETLWADVSHKIGLIGRGRPEHDAVETLYHATAFVPEILRDGFAAERPLDRRGLGNLGEVNATISFTHDLDLARNLMRSLKEIWMIAHGQLKARQIVSWIRIEGLEKQVSGMYPHGTNLDALNTPEEAVTLYRYWLAFSKMRVDPTFVSPERLLTVMADRKESDIGVLVCEVEISMKDEYFAGESEFRLTPDKVLSVKRQF